MTLKAKIMILYRSPGNLRPLEVTEADLRYEGPDVSALIPFLRRLGFRSVLAKLLERYPQRAAEALAEPPELTLTPKAHAPDQLLKEQPKALLNTKRSKALSKRNWLTPVSA